MAYRAVSTCGDLSSECLRLLALYSCVLHTRVPLAQVDAAVAMAGTKGTMKVQLRVSAD